MIVIRALGLYVFAIPFSQQCWGIVLLDVLAVCQEFHEHCKFARSINVTFYGFPF